MWDPGKYLAFADHRARPFHELVARIGVSDPRRVVDLGCGPGNLTETLTDRWPDAVIEALDSSVEMVAAARARGLDARVADAGEWTPEPDTDVLVTNAVLHWVPGHPKLLRRWAAELPGGAWIAMQVPGNFDSPSHTLVRGLVASSWSAELSGVLRDEQPVLGPAGYAEVLTEAGCVVDAWETTYLQCLEGANAVLEWISGTALRPIRSALGDEKWAAFRAELAPLLRSAYPERPDGTTWFPFRRIFAVGRTA
jgi:trans-aconitate 2-methyltransferase